MCEVPALMRIFLSSLRRRNDKHFKKMEALGVPARVPNRPPLWGALPVQLDANGHWQPAAPAPGERIRDAVVVPCGQHDQDNIFYSEIHDLLAFYLDNPGTWHLLRGDAVILGDDAVFDAGFYQKPLNLYSNPLDWLKAGGDGAVIIDWRLHPRFHLGDAPFINADTPALRHRLTELDEQYRAAPWSIKTTSTTAKVAA